MIKIHGLNKYYNKNRRNENHVLKDITLDFPSTGLVMLLGDSGSGKTTLLNVIGGLDASDSGSYTIDDTTIQKYDAKAVDALRNRKIGYIFQNYYLFPHETVHENIRLTLKMIGLTDEEEIDRRINHLLKLINMPQYKHRRANQLSGGQQQRIAIIRALAKDPSIIIADEPTGNLDSKNTLAIMRMLKEISKNKLIIMVTHEETIAKHYGDQIIRIEDGKILSQKQNGATGALDTTTDSDIYLGDLKHIKPTTESDDSLEIYRDDSTDQPLKARLIIQNKTLYIDIDGEYRNINFLRGETDTTIHESKREDVAKSETELPSIDYEGFDEDELSENKSVIPIKTTVETALNKVRQSSKLSKLLYLSFAFSAAIFMIAIGLLFNILFIGEEVFLEDPAYTFEVHADEFEDYESFLDFSEDFKAYNLSTTDQSIRFGLPRFYQTQSHQGFDVTMVPLSLTDPDALMHGRMPEAPYEIVISSGLAANMLENRTIVNTGISSEEGILNLYYDHDGRTVHIAGIVRDNAPVVFTSEAFLYDGLSNMVSVREAYTIDITSGRETESPDEILISQDMVVGGDFEPHDVEVLGRTFTAVGVYQSESGKSGYMLGVDAFKEAYFATLDNPRDTLLLYSDSQRRARNILEDAGLSQGFRDLYEIQHDSTQSERLSASRGLFVFSIITLSASALSFYFIIRSSMLKRIYEIGVYRALGVRRLDLIKMFWVEILILTTVSSLLGYGAMYYVLTYIDRQTRQFIDVLNLSLFTFLSGLALIYLINSVFGLLPLLKLLRKTPAEIHSSYDL